MARRPPSQGGTWVVRPPRPPSWPPHSHSLYDGHPADNRFEVGLREKGGDGFGLLGATAAAAAGQLHLPALSPEHWCYSCPAGEEADYWENTEIKEKNLRNTSSEKSTADSSPKSKSVVTRLSNHWTPLSTIHNSTVHEFLGKLINGWFDLGL